MRDACMRQRHAVRAHGALHNGSTAWVLLHHGGLCALNTRAITYYNAPLRCVPVAARHMHAFKLSCSIMPKSHKISSSVVSVTLTPHTFVSCSAPIFVHSIFSSEYFLFVFFSILLASEYAGYLHLGIYAGYLHLACLFYLFCPGSRRAFD